MPATFVKSYAAPDGEIFTTLAEEQKHELTCIVCGENQPTDAETKVIGVILSNLDKVLACLKQKERKNLRAPKVERKPRTPKAKPETT